MSGRTYFHASPELIYLSGAMCCEECGALVWSVVTHNRWHDQKS